MDDDCGEGKVCREAECVGNTPQLPQVQDSCEGITCSAHGQCALVGGEPTCACEEGYRPEGLNCLGENGAGGTGGTGGTGGMAGSGGTAGSGGQGGTGGTAQLDAGSVADAVAEDMAMVEADAAPPRPGAPCGDNCPDLDFVALAGGAFSMGGLADRPDTQPAHQVNVPDFELMRTEVTVGQYRACVTAGACDEPRTGNGYNWSANAAALENHPINGVSWINAGQFASWVGARLPSESEWEFAARSQGQDITYPWGDDRETCERLNFGGAGCNGDDGARTSRVCTHEAGHSAQGLCDMAGNVWEWVEDDFHDSYNGAPNDGAAWVDDPRGSHRVVRGGGLQFAIGVARAAFRVEIRPSVKDIGGGFRLARSAR